MKTKKYFIALKNDTNFRQKALCWYTEYKIKNVTRFPIAITVLCLLVLLMLAACSNKKNRNYRIITQHYIDSLDNAIMAQQPDTSNGRQLPSPKERILVQLIPNRYFETLRHYFTGTIANDEVKKFGSILIISEPYAFGGLSSSFKVNDKPFYFISPPYYQLEIKAGQHIYFIDHKYYHPIHNRQDPDSLTINLYEFAPTERKWKHYYRDKKSLVFSIQYSSDSLSPRWLEIKRGKIK